MSTGTNVPACRPDTCELDRVGVLVADTTAALTEAVRRTSPATQNTIQPQHLQAP
jgi:hypothetical protein